MIHPATQPRPLDRPSQRLLFELYDLLIKGVRIYCIPDAPRFGPMLQRSGSVTKRTENRWTTSGW